MGDKKILFEIFLENGEFKTRAKEAEDSLDKIEKKSSKTESTFSKLKNSWVGTTLAIGAMYMAFKKVVEVLGESVNAASKLQETQNKFDVVFANSKQQANDFAKTLQDAYGLAKEESMAFLAGTGDILTGLGMQSDKALELSNSVAQLGIDLASFSNVEGGSERAIAALTSAMTGEREALKAYGIVVSEEMVKAELQAQGKDKLTGKALNQAKAEATVAIAYSQSANAIGDMARSFDSYANIQRRVDSTLANMKAEIGAELLPAMSNLGLAFISASKDGNIFAVMLKTVVKFIGDVVNGYAILIALLNKNSLGKDNQANLQQNKQLMEVYKQNQKIVTDIYGSMDKAKEAAAGGNAEAKKALDMLEKQKNYMEDRLKTQRQGFEAEKEADNTLIKIKQNMANAEKDITDAVTKRQKEKEKESKQTSGSGSGKSRQADVDAYYVSIGSSSGADKVAMDKEIANARLMADQKLITEQEFQEAKLAIEEKYQQKAMDAFQKDLQAKMGAYQQFTGGLGSLASDLSNLISMNAGNQTTTIDNETQSQMDAIQEKYDAEKLAIENSLLTEEEKAAQLKALDEKRAREEKAIQDAAAKEKRKIARDAAQMQKKISMFETSVNIPTAAFMAWNSAMALPAPASFIVGAAMAAASTALGLAKLKMIQEQPLPSYAVGTWAVPYDQTAQIHKGEMIVPKTFADSVRAGEGTISSGGSDGKQVNNFFIEGIMDTGGFFETMQKMQDQKARDMGATIYKTENPY